MSRTRRKVPYYEMYKVEYYRTGPARWLVCGYRELTKAELAKVTSDSANLYSRRKTKAYFKIVAGARRTEERTELAKTKRDWDHNPELNKSYRRYKEVLWEIW